MDLNDMPATGNRFLLQDVLRKTWNFGGFVVSDALSIGSLVTHGFARDKNDAAYRALSAGVNMDMVSGSYIRYAADLVKDGKLPEAQIDAMVRPILAAKFRMGLFDNPYIDESKVESVLARRSTRATKIGESFDVTVDVQNTGQHDRDRKERRALYG